jgi:hypothetical protein
VYAAFASPGYDVSRDAPSDNGYPKKLQACATKIGAPHLQE